MRLFAIVIVAGVLASCGDSAQDEPGPDQSKIPCRQAGNYQAGKEGSYQPCCAGLVEVAQRSKVEANNGVPVCMDLPLRVYACIEGSCGDGRCEAPENVPCGCVLDCPGVTPIP